MSSATTSHAPMRAASALSGFAETCRDEPREVIETACHGSVGRSNDAQHPRMGNPRCDHTARNNDGEIYRLATRIRIDAVPGWARVRRICGKPGKWSRSSSAFRWIYLPVALYLRLPADPGILLPLMWRTRFAVLLLVVSRDALGLRRFQFGSPIIRARCRIDCGAVARAFPRLHHLFVPRDERRAHVVGDDYSRADTGGPDVGARNPIAELDANVGMADVRSLRRVLDDHPSDQRYHPCWS